MTPFLWAVLAAICWGFAPMFEKTGLQIEANPTLGVLVRTVGVLIGTLCLIPFMGRHVGQHLSEVSGWEWFYLGMGGLLASVVGQAFFYHALKSGEVSRVVPIGASYPILAFVIGLLFFKEPMTQGKVWGVAFVMAGVYLLR